MIIIIGCSHLQGITVQNQTVKNRTILAHPASQQIA